MLKNIIHLLLCSLHKKNFKTQPKSHIKFFYQYLMATVPGRRRRDRWCSGTARQTVAAVLPPPPPFHHHPPLSWQVRCRDPPDHIGHRSLYIFFGHQIFSYTPKRRRYHVIHSPLFIHHKWKKTSKLIFFFEFGILHPCTRKSFV